MIAIHDNVLTPANLEAVRQSAIDSGFGTWAPPTHTFGSGLYRGMCYQGFHSPMHLGVAKIMGQPIYPNHSFFRILTADEEKRLVHSDRNDGSYTAIAYLSDHDDISGTAFYRHRETGLTEMPPLQSMDTAQWNQEMQDDSKWEQLDFVRGLKGRFLVFSAPLFHARVPDHGIGSTPNDARMIWVCHYEI